MAKRPSLAEKMRQAVTPDTPPAAPMAAIPVRPAAAPPQEPRRAAGMSGFYASTRAGKKKVTAPLDPATHKRLRQLALDKDTTSEALLIEAISDLFIKYGKPPIT